MDPQGIQHGSFDRQNSRTDDIALHRQNSENTGVCFDLLPELDALGDDKQTSPPNPTASWGEQDFTQGKLPYVDVQETTHRRRDEDISRSREPGTQAPPVSIRLPLVNCACVCVCVVMVVLLRAEVACLRTDHASLVRELAELRDNVDMDIGRVLEKTLSLQFPDSIIVEDSSFNLNVDNLGLLDDDIVFQNSRSGASSKTDGTNYNHESDALRLGSHQDKLWSESTKTDPEENSSTTITAVPHVIHKRKANTTPNKKKRKEKRNKRKKRGNGKICKRIQPCLDTFKQNMTTEIQEIQKNQEHDLKQDIKNALKMKVDKFVGKFWKLFDKKLFFTEKGKCHENANLPGNPLGCLSHEVHYNQSGTPISIFHVDDSSQNRRIDYDLATGTFTVKTAGIYLVHFNVTVVDNQTIKTHHAAIFLNDLSMMACQQGGFRSPEYNDPTALYAHKYRICNVQGTLELQKGDRVQVRTMEDGMIIRMEVHRLPHFRFILLHDLEYKVNA